MILRVVRRKIEIFSPAINWLKLKRKFGTASQLQPEVVLNDKVRAECIKRLKLINITKINIDKVNKAAAVLVPLCTNDGKLGLLYTLRSNKVSMNRGQVSFPGGMKDKSDKSLEDTALRETWEELRIPKDSVQVWGCANVISRKDVTVLPVLGYIGEVDPKKLNVNKHEVEEAFVQPLEKLCNPELTRYTQFRNQYTLPAYLGGNHKIWGLTAIITHVIMSALVPDVYKHKLVNLPSIRGDKKISANFSDIRKY